MIRIQMDHPVEERFQFQIGHRFIETGFYFFGQKFSNTLKQLKKNVVFEIINFFLLNPRSNFGEIIRKSFFPKINVQNNRFVTDDNEYLVN